MLLTIDPFNTFPNLAKESCAQLAEPKDEARRQGFSPDTPVSSPPSSVNRFIQ